MSKGSLKKSFYYAIAGIVYALTRERNLRIHFLAAGVAIAAGIWLEISYLEWGMLAITITLVMVAEMINTAVEKTGRETLAAMTLTDVDRQLFGSSLSGSSLSGNSLSGSTVKSK